MLVCGVCVVTHCIYIYPIWSPGRGLIFYAEVESFASFAVSLLFFLRWADAFKCILESIYGGTLHLSTTAFLRVNMMAKCLGNSSTTILSNHLWPLPLLLAPLPHRFPLSFCFLHRPILLSAFLKWFNKKAVSLCLFDAWGKRFAIFRHFFLSFTSSCVVLLFFLSVFFSFTLAFFCQTAL